MTEKYYLLYPIILAFVIVGCNNSENECVDNERKSIVLTDVETSIVEKQNKGSIVLFGNISKIDASKNVCISPYSLFQNISMIANGANGESYSQIYRAFFPSGTKMSDINGCVAKLNKELPELDKNTTINIANSLWAQNGFSLTDDYVQCVQNKFFSEIFKADLSSETTRFQINDWCSRQTNGMIPTFMNENLPGDIKMAIFNAIYFKGKWASVFNPDKTKEEDFYNEDGKVVKVKMMNKKAECGYFNREGCSYLKMLYGNGAYSMIIILPDDKNGLDSMISNIDAEELVRLIDALKLFRAEVTLKIPRFKFAYDTQTALLEALLEMGVKNIFSDENADLSGISESTLSIGMLRQVTQISIDEDGTKVATVTGGDVCTNNPLIPVEFTVDHPFLFIIQEESTGAILFMGKVNNL